MTIPVIHLVLVVLTLLIAALAAQSVIRPAD